ncbi:MAG TPA: hypothetical protein VMP89_08385 [Solirubrobacteraceae bacterium]|nr:hypothetical protein [Solirubrobacteraceae bacterium]
MSWPSPVLRVVHFARRSRPDHGARAHANVVGAAAGRRHPAMAGLNVPPVHGHHCICQRCERQADAAA